MLHILSSSPWQCDMHVLQCMLSPNDDLLLIQNGVLAVVNDNLPKISEKNSVTVYALKEDAEARGLVDYIVPSVRLVNYREFVNLAIKHVRQMKW